MPRKRVTAKRPGTRDAGPGTTLVLIGLIVITLIVFSVFAVLVLKEPLHWKYAASFIFLMIAVYIMFRK